MTKRYYYPNRPVQVDGYKGRLEISASGGAFYNEGSGAVRLNTIFFQKINALAVTMPDGETVYVTNENGELVQKTFDKKEPETSEVKDGR